MNDKEDKLIILREILKNVLDGIFAFFQAGITINGMLNEKGEGHENDSDRENSR